MLRQSLAPSDVPHADPQTEGFGFSLLKALAQVSGDPSKSFDQHDLSAERSVNRLKFRQMAIETIYGYWLPDAYADEVRDKLASIERASLAKMMKVVEALRNASLSSVEDELDKHIAGLRVFFSAHAVKIEPKDNRKEKFRHFVKARQAWFADESRVEHLMRRLVVEKMPDIWGDLVAAQKFEASFFEDLALLFETPSRSWVAQVLASELNSTKLVDPDAIRLALETRLENGFSATVWWGEE